MTAGAVAKGQPFTPPVQNAEVEPGTFEVPNWVEAATIESKASLVVIAWMSPSEQVAETLAQV